MMSTAHSLHIGSVFQEASSNVAEVKRLYEVWKGSNRFCLGGRLVFGPDVRSLFLTLFLIISPVVVFCLFVGSYLMQDFSHSGVAILVVAVVQTSIVLSFLLLTSGRDPGIVPRNAHPPEPEDEPGSSSDWSGSMTPKLRLPRTKDLTINGVVVKVKYCDTCMLYRPPRCSHCSICNNCVERFDHHCPWVGQCIGRRNYPHFFGFVLSTTLLCFFVFSMCALRIKRLMDGHPPLTVWRALQKSPASGFLMAYTFLASWFVGGLTVFHLYLMSTNQTTYENFRYRYEKRINPFNEGMLRNVWKILCSAIPSSKVNFRAKVPKEVAGFGSFSYHKTTGVNMDTMDLKREKYNCDMRHDLQWMAKAADNVEDIHGFPSKFKESIEGSKSKLEDPSSEDFSKSFEHEYHIAKNSAAQPRHGRQSGNWHPLPELLSFGPGPQGLGQ